MSSGSIYSKYDFFIVINYNTNPVIRGKGSAIFLHLTKKYKSTNGCIAVKIENFLQLLKFVKKGTKVIIS